MSRGERPDLASSKLANVRCPTPLNIGGADDVVLAFNRQAASRLLPLNRVAIVLGVTHRFEELRAAEVATRLAIDRSGEHMGQGTLGDEMTLTEK